MTTTEVVSLVAGDWSGDGHEKTYEKKYYSNYSADAIQKAIVASIKQLGLPFYNPGYPTPGWESLDICSEYEDNVVPPEIIALFTDEEKEMYIDEWDSDYPTIDADGWMELHIKLAKMQLPALEINEIETPPSNTIRINGYGLF